MVWNYDCRITRVCSAHRRRRCSGTHDEGDPSAHKNLVCCRSLLGSGSIPKIFLDSHTKRPELRESYQLQELRFAFILFSAVQVLRRGGEVQLPVRRKWVRASARKKAFGSRSRQAKCSACPHPRVGKIRSLGRARIGGLGAHRTAGRCSISELSCFAPRPPQTSKFPSRPPRKALGG